MKKIVQFKYIFVCMAALILVTSFFAFSVSYAKWTGANDIVSATVQTGQWDVYTLSDFFEDVNKQPATGAINKLKESLSEADKNKSQVGGVIATDGTVRATAWENVRGERHGYTIENVYLAAGESFIICVFNRVVDPNNSFRGEKDQGYAILKGNGLEKLSYSQDKNRTDDDRVIFTVKESGYYSFEVYENTEWDFIAAGRKTNQDIVTITYKTEI